MQGFLDLDHEALRKKIDMWLVPKFTELDFSKDADTRSATLCTISVSDAFQKFISYFQNNNFVENQGIAPGITLQSQ